uniref:ankyrin repeat-containing protein At5g02620-like n=1 Tax=Erigeron canadensis TaxID=72917 RepID=UPI001CB97F9E|nr:ankyrin repeat-containing protein At5g02620-like [Erigeron canadensis]
MHEKNKSHDERDNQALKLVERLLKLYPISISGQLDILYAPKEYVLERMTPRVLLFTAAEMGNTRFLIEIVRMFPHNIYQTDGFGKSIFHIAIERRNKDIYNLLYETVSYNRELSGWEDLKKNNLLHLLALTTKNTAQLHQTGSKASILMQRELLWYKEVEMLVQPSFRNKKNEDGKTPYEIFSENNEDLVSKGMKWTKDCMVVATLIITVAFAVAFTVPGGYDQKTGIPILDHDTSFLVFIIADAFSLFTSSTSLLVFLSILTSPHDQRDFLYAMPVKLMIGLVALFMSVAAMMVTFAASFFVIYQNTYKWLAIIISVSAATPVITFAILQYPFVMDMYRSIFNPRYLFNTGKCVLYDKKKRL